ncbi:MAG TPA: cyanophycin synthetase, partial [Candidatus Acidoferrales bacterium]
ISILNALGASALAFGRGVAGQDIARALATFRSPRRRMQVVAEVRGVTLVDDFAHHPTAIAETIAAARVRWPGRRVWAVVEPRSNTMRTKVFEAALPGVLAAADAVAIGPVHRAHLLKDDERLSPAAVAAGVRALGREAAHYDSADAIVDVLASKCREGDVVLVMSNGSFDGLHQKLAAKLEGR